RRSRCAPGSRLLQGSRSPPPPSTRPHRGASPRRPRPVRPYDLSPSSSPSAFSWSSIEIPSAPRSFASPDRSVDVRHHPDRLVEPGPGSEIVVDRLSEVELALTERDLGVGELE